ncbi:MAG TPA: aldose epimerase family protein [Ferruginibacter sp.]|nr:aldose epimerase family protein [Ferruginibacter sp.]
MNRNPSITEAPFGSVEGKAVTAYTITNITGMQVSIIDYGATIIKIITKDKDGVAGNVILGFNSVEGYIKNGVQYFGSIVGRFCNRIANASFILDGKEYKLAANAGLHHLHGGIKGFDKAIWQVEKQPENNSIKLAYLSKDGEEGYPGNLQVEVKYTLTNNNAVIIEYVAKTDMATPVNLTNHCYFNLSAGKLPDVLNHILYINAQQFTPPLFGSDISKLTIIEKDSPLDFSIAKKIGTDINKLADNYDHNMVLEKDNAIAAELYDPSSGRLMEVFTTEPCLQLYSGNFLHNTVIDGAERQMFNKHGAICLETQHFPNSPNEPDYPNTILRPGSIYRQKTEYKFSTR